MIRAHGKVALLGLLLPAAVAASDLEAAWQEAPDEGTVIIILRRDGSREFSDAPTWWWLQDGRVLIVPGDGAHAGPTHPRGAAIGAPLRMRDGGIGNANRMAPPPASPGLPVPAKPAPRMAP